MAAVPAVSFDIRIGQLVQSGLIAEVDIDYDKLDETLTELGEPDDPLHPLHILLMPCGLKEDDSGQAFTTETHRVVQMPLAQVELAKKSSTQPEDYPGEDIYTIDAWHSNSTLLHELRHAVDYNDASLLQKAIDEKKRARNIARVARCYNYVTLSSFTTMIGVEAVNAASETERVAMIGCMGGLAVAASFFHRYINLREKSYIWFERELERRAYHTEAEWRAEDKLPDIIRFYAKADRSVDASIRPDEATT